MLKGKKFTAAEKHFQDKEVALRQEMRKTIEWSEEIINVNNQLYKENRQLKKDFDELKEKYSKLLEYSNMTEEDIKTALHKDKVMDQFGSLMGVMGQGLGRYL